VPTEPRPPRGTTKDPDFRHRRAVRAAKARTSVDAHIKALVESAPPLTAEQRGKLLALLRSA
jgi:hypothetical protein